MSANMCSNYRLFAHACAPTAIDTPVGADDVREYVQQLPVIRACLRSYPN